MKWLLQNFYSLILMTAVAVYVSLYKSKNILTLLLVIWCIFALSVILLQGTALWEYHYLLLFVPIGILATKGLDILWDSLKGLKISNPNYFTGIFIVLTFLFHSRKKEYYSG